MAPWEIAKQCINWFNDLEKRVKELENQIKEIKEKKDDKPNNN